MGLFHDNRFKIGEVLQVEVGEICGRIKYTQASYARKQKTAEQAASKPSERDGTISYMATDSKILCMCICFQAPQ